MVGKNISEKLSGVQKNILLSDHTTFRIGGPAKYFFVAKSSEDIVKAISAAKENNLPFFILGGGSNLLVADRGFGGLIVKVSDFGFRISDLKIRCSAGVLLSKLVTGSVNNGLTGLEWAAGIPGTIGGAVVGNAAAYGHSMQEIVKKVIALAPDESFSIKEYNAGNCEFRYRDSVFKRKTEIILEVEIELKRGDKKKSKEEIKNILLERKRKNPPYPSAGSVFKNIRITELTQTGNRFYADAKIEIPAERIRSGKVAAGYLIEECGLKGKQIGQAKISDEHANFIVNLGGAKAENVVALIDLCKKEVKKKFGIELEEEIKYLGF